MCIYLQTLTYVLISVQMTLLAADRAVLFWVVQQYQEHGSSTAALCDSRSQPSWARLYLTAVCCSSKPHASTSANVCDVVYQPGSQHYSTLRYSISWGKKQILSGLLRSPHLFFRPGNHVPEGNLVCTRLIVLFFFRAHLFVLAPLSETSDGVGRIRPLGSRCRSFGRDPCSVSRVASL